MAETAQIIGLAAEPQIIGLAAERGFPRVSLFMPTTRGGPDVRQGPVRYKNLLREATRMLRDRGLGEGAARTLLAAASELGEDDVFWRHREDGLGVFISHEGLTTFSSALSFEPQVHVSDQFVVRPLLPLLMRDGTFFVLTASNDAVTLYRGSRFGLSRIEDSRIPASAEVVTGPAEIENAVGFHAASRGATAIRVHALGQSPTDAAEDLIEEFARRIARSVEAVLAGVDAPLVLAADDRMLGKLRRAISRKGLAEEGIRQHPDSLDAATLHGRAYEIVRGTLDADRRGVIELMQARLGAGSGASDRIDQILDAATEGRVDVLVVAADPGNPATLGWEPGQAPPAEDQLAELDRAILETLAHGGRILTRPADRASDLPAVGALYRY